MLNDTIDNNDGLWKNYRVSFIGRVRGSGYPWNEPHQVIVYILASSKEEAVLKTKSKYEYLWGQLHVDQEWNGKILVEDRVKSRGNIH